MKNTENIDGSALNNKMEENRKTPEELQEIFKFLNDLEIDSQFQNKLIPMFADIKANVSELTQVEDKIKEFDKQIKQISQTRRERVSEILSMYK